MPATEGPLRLTEKARLSTEILALYVRARWWLRHSDLPSTLVRLRHVPDGDVATAPNTDLQLVGRSLGNITTRTLWRAAHRRPLPRSLAGPHGPSEPSGDRVEAGPCGPPWRDARRPRVGRVRGRCAASARHASTTSVSPNFELDHLPRPLRAGCGRPESRRAARAGARRPRAMLSAQSGRRTGLDASEAAGAARLKRTLCLIDRRIRGLEPSPPSSASMATTRRARPWLRASGRIGPRSRPGPFALVLWDRERAGADSLRETSSAAAPSIYRSGSEQLVGDSESAT